MRKDPNFGDGYNLGMKTAEGLCAAGPWTYRTDTGDEKGKVVESADLSEKSILAQIDTLILPTFLYRKGPCFYAVRIELRLNDNEPVERLMVISFDWLRKHLKAFAEIHGGE